MIDVRLTRYLWSFLAVAEERHFGRAAERLGISQPPLTQQIQILERSLGMRLFDRSRRGATLTPEGQAILPAVQRFAEQLERLESVVRAAKGRETKLINIGALTSTFYDVLPRILERARKELPDATPSFVEIHTADAIPLLKSGDIDIAFSRLGRSVGTIRVEPLIYEPLMVALPAQHPLASQETVALETLADEAWIQVRRRLSPPSFDRIIAACSEAGFSPRIAHEVGSEGSQLAYVSCGLGIALLPVRLLRFTVPNLTFRPLDRQIELLTLSLAYDEQRVTPVARAFIDFAMSEAK
jgi:DNA-binding transcriptional LysR family regulator